MFKLIGAAVALYTVLAVASGKVYAKSGVWGSSISRQDAPKRFWTVIAVYAALSVALLTVF